MAVTTLRRATGANVATGFTRAFALAFTLTVVDAARADEMAEKKADEDAPSPPGQVELRAENVEIDARTRELDVSGDVRVDASPFHLRSDRLHVRRSPHGIEIEGDGRLAFCPCLGSPLAIDFHAATVAPPGDLLLTSPTLVVYGVPVAWLPYFWLRSGARAGLLPPDITYRGADGVFLGGGVHLPASSSGDGERALDLRAGAYLNGGAAVDGRLVTAQSITHVRWDHLGGDGLTVDLRGSTAGEREADALLVWDVDALRGARGVASTTELDAAARPYDRGAVSSALRLAGWTLGTGVRAAALRGGELSRLGAVGPVAFLRNAGALGFVGSYDATVEGGALRDDSGAAASTLSVARGELGAGLAQHLGPVLTSLEGRASGGVAGAGSSASPFGFARAELRAALPVERAFVSTTDPENGDPPLVHRLEPSLGAALLTVHEDDTFGLSAGRGAVVQGAAWVADGALSTALSRWGSRAGGELTVRAGFVGALDSATPVAFATCARAAVQGELLALGAEGAQVASVGAGAGESGGALVARGRVGPSSGLHALLLAAGRDGIDPVLARALTGSALEPGSGFLSTRGWTGGGALAIPFTAKLVTAAGLDVDLTRGELVAARASVELHDGCHCVVLRATASHRIGREGVDAALTLDLAPKL